MPDENYTVKINRREGIVEITGPDKNWIAEQLERLAVVYEPEPEDDTAPETLAAEGSDDGSTREPIAATTAPAATTTTTAEPRRRGRSAFRGTVNDELETKLTAEVRTKLGAYVDERRPKFKDAPDQAAILAAFLEDEIDWRGVSADDLYTVYVVMGWPAPNPAQRAPEREGPQGVLRCAARGEVQPHSHGGAVRAARGQERAREVGGAERSYFHTIPTTSSTNAETFFTPGVYFTGCPHWLRRSNAWPSNVFSLLSSSDRS
jgi:hypothetical protein